MVNYDGFDLDSDLEDAYLDAVQDIGLARETGLNPHVSEGGS